ncbi:dTDP-4-dehydrorhamnose 3,5-epimerase [Gemmobacter caeni]|uniref:dTDP-4-dehydrorhamnose 3,5-epimerase n=1 Tax=Gemmobacter caeni TaxID=589035 RepID=A0A2T6AFT2_9RHOB|nr:dTDP-4-dehydrorhamnose 3,5-epimerase family protein [Gemmobacter caeni]PTX42671.1 dTDP-4-dehydrorhamnose 3,5-epimerase [Gemmobacter caeni]TWI93553.1 dTDP-4-dehydrorhamnose 3,5-epimerase [Gemmobacter caeni]
MRQAPTPLPDVWLVESQSHEDARGGFRRSWCAASFAAAGVDFTPVQASLSTNTAPHTLRGLHWQAEPKGEQKLVRCVAGRIQDVALDLRPESPGYLRWHAVELSAENGAALLLPRGVAHGFLTLTPGAVVEYLMDVPHSPEAARGARWDDPAFGIRWAAPPAAISGRDRDWPDFVHG